MLDRSNVRVRGISHTWTVTYSEGYSLIPEVSTTVTDIVSYLECQLQWRIHSNLIPGVSTTVRDIVSYLKCQLQ
jgi:hypothetical protein